MSNAFEPNSYVAMALMRSGANRDEMPERLKRAETLAYLAGREDAAFIGECLVNMKQDSDIFDEIELLRNLRECPDALFTASVFANALDKVHKATTPDRVNMYYGTKDKREFSAWLCRLSDWMAGEWNDPAARVSALKAAAGVVLNGFYDAKKRYDAEWFRSPETEESLYRMLVENPEERPPFVAMLQEEMDARAGELAKNVVALEKGIKDAEGAFSAGGRFSQENVSKAFQMLSGASSSAYAFAGVKKWGDKAFRARIEELNKKLDETKLFMPKKTQILIRLASGGGENIDMRWLEYIDPKNPFGYQIPKDLSAKSKFFGMACQGVEKGIELDKFCENVKQQIAGHQVLSRISANNQDLAVSVFCMIGKGVLSERPFDIHDEGWEAFRDAVRVSGPAQAQAASPWKGQRRRFNGQS